MLLSRDPAGNEDAQMADFVVDRVDDGLAIGADFIDVLIQIENPSERLLWRRDVVALGAKYHDRRTDIAKVDGQPFRRLDFPAARLLPTNNSSTINWISSALRLT